MPGVLWTPGVLTLAPSSLASPRTSGCPDPSFPASRGSSPCPCLLGSALAGLWAPRLCLPWRTPGHRPSQLRSRLPLVRVPRRVLPEAICRSYTIPVRVVTKVFCLIWGFCSKVYTEGQRVGVARAGASRSRRSASASDSAASVSRLEGNVGVRVRGTSREPGNGPAYLWPVGLFFFST